MRQVLETASVTAVLRAFNRQKQPQTITTAGAFLTEGGMAKLTDHWTDLFPTLTLSQML